MTYRNVTFPLFYPFEFGPMTIRQASPCTFPYHEFKRKTLEFFLFKIFNQPSFFFFIYSNFKLDILFFSFFEKFLVWFFKLDILITFFFFFFPFLCSKFKVQTIIFIPLKKKTIIFNNFSLFFGSDFQLAIFDYQLSLFLPPHKKLSLFLYVFKL